MAIGMLVIVLNFHEFTGCVGTLKAQEEKLAMLTMVYCPNGAKYDYVAGIPLKTLEEFDHHADISSYRSRQWSK